MAAALQKRLYWGRLRLKYGNASPKKKSQFLDEITHLTGMNRKYVIRKLNQKGRPKKRRPGPSPTYESSIYRPILKRFWLASDQPCSKKLKVILPEWLPFYEQAYGVLMPQVSEKLLRMKSSYHRSTPSP